MKRRWRRKLSLCLAILLFLSWTAPAVYAEDTAPLKTRCVFTSNEASSTAVVTDGDGRYVLDPAIAPKIKLEGAFCEYKGTSSYTRFHVTNPQPVQVMTESIQRERAVEADVVGRTLVVWVDQGTDVSRMLVTIDSIFSDIDPRTGGQKYNTPGSTYFAETGFSISPKFLSRWLASGGLSINGFPISPEGQERLEDGHLYTVQYFERARFEYHPENTAPYDVLLGQFGRKVNGGIDPSAEKALDHTCSYFQLTPEIGHNICGLFGEYWLAHGGLSQFGLPITEQKDQVLDNGKTYQVQYFERARFEYHPENAQPFDVLLGQFGRRIVDELAQSRLTAAGTGK